MTSQLVHPKLTSWACADLLPDVESWVPGNHAIDYLLEFAVDAGAETTDTYQVRVIDATTLSRDNPAPLRATIIVDAHNYSFATVKTEITRILDGCIRADWADCTAALNRWFIWGNEDRGFVDGDGNKIPSPYNY